MERCLHVLYGFPIYDFSSKREEGQVYQVSRFQRSVSLVAS